LSDGDEDPRYEGALATTPRVRAHAPLPRALTELEKREKMGALSGLWVGGPPSVSGFDVQRKLVTELEGTKNTESRKPAEAMWAAVQPLARKSGGLTNKNRNLPRKRANIREHSVRKWGQQWTRGLAKVAQT